MARGRVKESVLNAYFDNDNDDDIEINICKNSKIWEIGNISRILESCQLSGRPGFNPRAGHTKK